MEGEFVLSGVFETPFPKKTFGEIVLYALKKHDPHKAAMVDGVTNKIITNQQLIEESTKIAIAFQKLGVQKNDVIAILSENCLNYFIPVLSSIYIGAVVNLINNAYKAAEISNAFNISKPKMVIVSESCREIIKSIKEQFDCIEVVVSLGKGDEGIYSFDDVLKLGGEQFENFQPTEVDIEDQVCMVLCSSGTTGLPKGVMLTHNNLRMAMTYTIGKDLLNMTNTDSTIGLMPFYHTFGVIVSLGCIVSGMKQVVLSKFKPDLFLKAIQEHKITKLFVVPPLILFLAKSPMVDDYDLTSLKYIFCAAAPLGQEIQALVEKRLNVKIRQGYGLTEAGGIVTLHRTEVSVSKAGSSGTVVCNSRLKVVDIKSGKPLGPNDLGEILVKSEMNMKGYMNNEEATQNAFDNDGFLKTGDIGYYDEDGYFFIVDRLKELIKYKGFQVPPAELENILVTHKCVKEAGVIGVPDEKCGELPLAFVVKQPDCDVTEEEIIKFVAGYSSKDQSWSSETEGLQGIEVYLQENNEYLKDSMDRKENIQFRKNNEVGVVFKFVSVPKQLHGGVRFIDELPKNPTGKLLRRKLKELLV